MEEVGLFGWVTANWDQVIVTVLAVMGAAAAVAALTPTPKDDNIVAWVRKIVDALAMNFGNAKNETKKPDEQV